MGRTLSEDLRLRVIAAVEAGLSRRAAAERFGVGIATAIRWMRAFKATGSTRAQPKGGDQRSHRIEAYRDVILGVLLQCARRRRIGVEGGEQRRTGDSGGAGRRVQRAALRV